MYNRQTAQNRRPRNLEIDGVGYTKKNSQNYSNLKSSKDLYHQALKTPFKELKASTKAFGQNRNSYSKLKSAKKTLPTNLNENHVSDYAKAITSTIIFNQREHSRNQSNGKSTSELILTDRYNHDHSNMNVKNSVWKNQKSLSLKKLRTEVTPTKKQQNVSEDYERIFQQLTEENQKLRRSLSEKQQDQIQIKVQDLLAMVQMLANQRTKYAQAKTELQFLKTQSQNCSNTIFKVLNNR